MSSSVLKQEYWYCLVSHYSASPAAGFQLSHSMSHIFTAQRALCSIASVIIINTTDVAVAVVVVVTVVVKLGTRIRGRH